MKDFLAAMGIQKTRVAGLSFGGWPASLLVLHCPEQVSHAVWMAPGGTIGALSMGFWLRLLPASLLFTS
ncbi:MAG TPA: alpha/beta hydrolase [Pseudomonadota bacterium]|jgi:pimeloyl-ACP methyl ester carboxylesterase|nr:alpha/beta hydrolase [Pseudomonadota bacterium]